MLLGRDLAGRSFSVLTRGEGARFLPFQVSIVSRTPCHSLSETFSVQSAGKDRAGDLEGDGDLIRHLSHQTGGAIAGLQVLWLFTINDLSDSRCEMIDEGRQMILFRSPQGLHERRRGGDQENRRLCQPDGEPSVPQSPRNQDSTRVKDVHHHSFLLYFNHTRTFTNQR